MATSTRGPSRRHGRPSSATVPSVNREPLTRSQVLHTALDIIDADGVDALSMRRLAQRLERDPMSLYRHAASKAALLDGVTELVLDELVVPAVEGTDWDGALRKAAESFRSIALAHPRMVPLLVTRPLATPLGLRPPGTLRALEEILDLFVAAGFSPPDALHAYRLFIGFLQGHALNEVQELVENPEETDDLLRLGLHHLPLRDFPRIRALATDLADYDGRLELEQGLDIILGGLRSQLAGGAA